MNIRNFCIIAHVDHGKSTLADRLLEITGTITGDKMKPQLLDSLALERERGITIKLAPVRMKYKIRNPNIEIRNKLQIQNSNNLSLEIRNSNLEFADLEYTLNLIDTPGHVDFSYEVSRSLVACEGAVLLVDATQGVQAQTLSHGLAAMEQNLTLIPVINKVDMLSTLRSPNGDLKIDFTHPQLEKCKLQLVDTFGFNESEILFVSGKTGEGIKELLQAIVDRIPPPKSAGVKLFHPGGGHSEQLRALVFDSFFDAHKGVIAQVRVFDGEVPGVGSKIKFLATGAEGEILEKGYFGPGLVPVDNLESGEIGYIATGIKEPDLVRVGDTVTISHIGGVIPLPGYKEVKPMIYVGLYPIEQAEFHDLKNVLAKFRLSDPAFSYEIEHSNALGAGFRCGFLGLLHAEVVQQRLSEEFSMDLLATTPSVEYLLDDKPITNPADLPQGLNLVNLQEPWVKIKMFTPQSYLGKIMDLLSDKRGIYQNQTYFGSDSDQKKCEAIHFGTQVELIYEMPLSEMITDFYDKLKSVSSGFASLDWDFLEFRKVDAVRIDILVGGEKVDALSTIIVKSKAESVGRRLTEKLKEVLPKQNFAIAIQAVIGGNIIARETISAFRKDVIEKLYGGDRTRKDKLLEAQKKGKKKMKMIGRVEIPQEAFLSILKS